MFQLQCFFLSKVTSSFAVLGSPIATIIQQNRNPVRTCCLTAVPHGHTGWPDLPKNAHAQSLYLFEEFYLFLHRGEHLTHSVPWAGTARPRLWASDWTSGRWRDSSSKTAVKVYILFHINAAFAEKPSKRRHPQSSLKWHTWAKMWATNTRQENGYPGTVETIRTDTMSHADAAWHARSLSAFLKIHIEAFYLKVGGEIKQIALWTIKKKPGVDKGLDERNRTGKGSVLPHLQCSGMDWKRKKIISLGKKRVFKKKNFIRKRRDLLVLSHTRWNRKISQRLGNKEEIILPLKYRRGAADGNTDKGLSLLVITIPRESAKGGMRRVTAFSPSDIITYLHWTPQDRAYLPLNQYRPLFLPGLLSKPLQNASTEKPRERAWKRKGIHIPSC